MLKKISKLNGVQELNRAEQKTIKGGIGPANCPIYTPERCTACGGFPASNGCCFGIPQVHQCLTGSDPG
ncbi:MAG: hypothetical protein ACI9Y7_000355 [Dokdonia sp.]|jgi:hypothetical protein